jgi:lipoate-protein ligase A
MSDEKNWRLIWSEACAGARNMATDEAILEEAAAGRSRPTLRLYAWAPPALSLGYAQRSAEVDRAALARLGWDLVRRPTGGRAILHTDELTYSVAAPEAHPLLAGGVLESYRRLSLGLLAALRLLGVAAEAGGSHARGGAHGAVCFESPSDYEITAGGRKLIGSAQARRVGGVLQHGTLPLTGDLARIVQALAKPDTPPEHVRARAATLREAAGRAIGWEEAAEAVSAGFAAEFGLSFERGGLSPAEAARAETLIREKYASDGWTMRV